MITALRRSVLALCLYGGLSYADDAAFRYFFDLAPRSAEELAGLLEDLQPEISMPSSEVPIVIILHGSEANAFVRSNYAENKSLVDRAALLDAYGVIEMRICATWMRLNNVDGEDIPAFIEPVPYGAAEIERLRGEGYQETPAVRI